ncbi:MAG: response regulator transcription factor [Ardenticatenaceae bacterium]|nr:response regulator transcription factor [Ardenticatenaceae bacterium]
MRIRMLIVAETPLVGNVVKHLMENEEDMQVVGCVTTTRQALDVLSGESCDLALIHSQLGQRDALSLVHTLTLEYPSLKSVVVDLPNNKDVILPYLETGACGYILRGDSVPEMIRKVRAVQAGKPVICSQVTAALMGRLAELADNHHNPTLSLQPTAKLTRREREVLKLLAQNLSNREIAHHLVIEVGTVKNHVHRILKKLNVHNRRAAAAYLSTLDGSSKPGWA